MGYKSKYSGKEIEEKLDTVYPLPSEVWDIIDNGDVLGLKKYLEPIRYEGHLGNIDTGCLIVTGSTGHGDKFNDDFIYYRLYANSNGFYIYYVKGTAAYEDGEIRNVKYGERPIFYFEE